MPTPDDLNAPNDGAPAGPFAAFADAAKINPEFAKAVAIIPIFIAAVAAALTYANNDPKTALTYLAIGLVIFVGLTVVTRISAIWQDIQTYVVWLVRFIIVVLGLFVANVVYTLVSTGAGGLPCAVMPGQPVCQLAGKISTPSAPLAVPATPPPPTAVPFTVFTQFSNMPPATIAALRSSLSAKGWTVPAAEDMTQKLPGQWNEIRVNPAMDPAAVAKLVNDVSASLNGRPITVRLNASVNPTRPEIWVSGP